MSQLTQEQIDDLKASFDIFDKDGSGEIRRKRAFIFFEEAYKADNFVGRVNFFRLDLIILFSLFSCFSTGQAPLATVN